MWRSLAAPLLAAILLLGSAAPAAAAKDFQGWLAGFRREAAAAGISRATLDTAFAGVAPLARVIELDRRQPERTLTFDQYVRNVVNNARVERGRRLLVQHREVLEAVGRRYGVPPRVVVALWGIETDFGRHTGGFRVVDALATLAYDGRRSRYFRAELLDALRILEQRHTTADQMRGSWAGALGQCQFMPSSFRRFAVDHNGDGRRDIWHTEADVFASAANYLARNGWQAGQSWGREVKLPPGFNTRLAGLNKRKPLAEWQALGVRGADGGDLPATGPTALLVLPDGAGGRAFLVHDNFRTVMRWNRSTFFATSVGLLADRIGGAEEIR